MSAHHYATTIVQTIHGRDMDTVTDDFVSISIKLTKQQVIEAILKTKPTWEKRGNRLYNGVGEPVMIVWSEKP